MRWIASSALTPITESCGPVMPASRERGGPARLNARVVRLHVRVRPEDGRHLAVEVARQRDLLARRLAVEVDEDDRRLPLRLLDELVDDLERRHRRRHEQVAEEVDHRDPRSVACATRPSSPRPGDVAARFAGRITRSVPDR